MHTFVLEKDGDGFGEGREEGCVRVVVTVVKSN